MPLIEKEKRESYTELKVKIEAGLAEQFSAYCKYLESSPSYVVAEALRYVMAKDKEFVSGIGAK